MYQVKLDDAKEQLVALVEAAVQGKAVFITKDDQSMVQLVPVFRTRRRRKFGSARGMIAMADDFDDPLVDFSEYMELA